MMTQLIPWVDGLDSAKSVQDIIAGLKIWAVTGVAKQAVVSGPANRHARRQEIKDALRKAGFRFKIIDGLKVYSVVPKPKTGSRPPFDFDNLEHWNFFFAEIERLRTMRDTLLLDLETAWDGIVNGTRTMPNLKFDSPFTEALRNLAAMPIKLVWYPAAVGADTNLDRAMTILDHVDRYLKQDQLSFVSLERSYPDSLRSTMKRTAHARLSTIDRPMIPQMFCYESTKTWTTNGVIAHLILHGRDAPGQTLLYPGSDAWVEKSKELAKAFSEAGWGKAKK